MYTIFSYENTLHPHECSACRWGPDTVACNHVITFIRNTRRSKEAPERHKPRYRQMANPPVSIDIRTSHLQPARTAPYPHLHSHTKLIISAKYLSGFNRGNVTQSSRPNLHATVLKRSALKFHPQLKVFPPKVDWYVNLNYLWKNLRKFCWNNLSWQWQMLMIIFIRNTLVWVIKATFPLNLCNITREIINFRRKKAKVMTPVRDQKECGGCWWVNSKQ